jgi:hypothetical protein
MKFPLVMKWPALRFNQIVVGFAQPNDKMVLAQRAEQAPEDILPLTDLLTRDWTQVAAMDDFWTDDRCPVEWVTDRMIILYGVSGKDREEQLLPTAP